MNTCFAIAAVLSVFNSGLHFFLGGKTIAKPLLNTVTLTDQIRYVLYFCWHIATLTLMLQAVLFSIAAIMPEEVSLPIIGTILAAAIGALGISIPPLFKISYKTMPQGWLFIPVTIFGFAGLTL